MEPIIEVRELIKSFDDLLILNKVSLNISKGEILSVLGPSGSGKTTLLKCIIGLENFNSTNTSIKIKNQNSNEYLKQNRIAFVPQHYSNYPWLNVFENIKLGMISHSNMHVLPSHAPSLSTSSLIEKKRNLLLKEEKDKKVKEIIETVGLSGFEKYTINKLSGGMQQRVAIGRAIAQDTDIIAFDEPFGALDFKIREKLQLIVKDLNKTILFVTHDIEEAIFIADSLIVLSKTPTSITNGYKLPFRSNMNVDLKFEQEFVNLRKEIQNNFSSESDNIISPN